MSDVQFRKRMLEVFGLERERLPKEEVYIPGGVGLEN